VTILVGEDHYDKSIVYKKNIGIQVNEVRTENNDEDSLKKLSRRVRTITLNSDSIEHIQPYH
jgi:hypothetical protein